MALTPAPPSSPPLPYALSLSAVEEAIARIVSLGVLGLHPSRNVQPRTKPRTWLRTPCSFFAAQSAYDELLSECQRAAAPACPCALLSDPEPALFPCPSAGAEAFEPVLKYTGSIEVALGPRAIVQDGDPVKPAFVQQVQKDLGTRRGRLCNAIFKAFSPGGVWGSVEKFQEEYVARAGRRGRDIDVVCVIPI